VTALRIELRRIDDDRLITTLEVADLGEVPHPGRWLTLEERSYLVLQRRHRYRLCNGRYELASIALQVKAQRQPADARYWNGRWVIGDPSCRFNARSPLLRCAVLPEGPCARCAHYAAAPHLG
jgi:hypothetical protein